MKVGRKSQVLILCYLIQMFASCQSEDPDPGTLYFGFFFDEITAKSIKTATDAYFNSTLLVPAYHDFLQNISSKAGIDALNYYTKPLDPNTLTFDPTYHVTLKYCGNDQKTCEEYAKKHAQHISQTFELHLVGFVLTNRTFGIRVNLTDAQLPFFDSVKADYSVNNKHAQMSTTSGTLDLQGIRFEPLEPFPPLLPASNSKAHVTLGCGPGIPAVTTGPDMEQANEYESRSEENVTRVSYNIPDPFDDQNRNMLITQYETEDPVFVIYPRVKILANAKLLPYKRPTKSAGSIASFTTQAFLYIFILLFQLN